jgi:hypothetical protein
MARLLLAADAIASPSPRQRSSFKMGALPFQSKLLAGLAAQFRAEAAGMDNI